MSVMTDVNLTHNCVNETGTQVKVSRTAGVPLYSRMDPVVIKLLLPGSEGDGLKTTIELSWNVIIGVNHEK